MEVRRIEDLQEINGYKPLAGQLKFHRRPEKYLLLSGGYGSSKTCGLVNHCLFHLLKFEGSKVLLTRNYLTSLKRSTLVELRKWLPRELIKGENKSEGRIELVNGSMLFYAPLGDNKQSLDKLLSTEYSGIFCDELSEVNENSWNLLVSRLRFTGIPESGLQMVACSNPCSGWVKKRFVDFLDDNYFTVHLDITQNKYLPKSYISDLKHSLNESQWGALIYGSWEDILEVNSLFDVKQIEDAMKRKGNRGNETVYAIDVGEMGDDSSVIARRSGNKVEIIKKVSKKPLSVLLKIVEKVVKHNTEVRIIVDALGLGNGLYNMLDDHGYNAIPFKGNMKSYLPDFYGNRKSEIAFELLDRLDEISLPKDSNLREQMAETKYTTNNRDLICVESNKARKRRGLESANEFDAVAMLFSLDIDEDSEGLLKKMLANMLAVTQKKGETRPGKKQKIKEVASIGNVTGKPAKKLPREFTQEEMLNKSENEIFDNYARSKGYQKHIPVSK